MIKIKLPITLKVVSGEEAKAEIDSDEYLVILIPASDVEIVDNEGK